MSAALPQTRSVAMETNAVSGVTGSDARRGKNLMAWSCGTHGTRRNQQNMIKYSHLLRHNHVLWTTTVQFFNLTVTAAVSVWIFEYEIKMW